MLSADKDKTFAFAITLDGKDAEPFAYNAASCHVLEKAGFVCEGILKSNAYKNGNIVDMKMYALVKQ